MLKSVFSLEILSLLTRKIQGVDCDGLSSPQAKNDYQKYLSNLIKNTFCSRFDSIAKTIGGSIRFRNYGIVFFVILNRN